MLTPQEQEELNALEGLIPVLDEQIATMDEALQNYDSSVKAAFDDGDKQLEALDAELGQEEAALQRDIEEENINNIKAAL